MLTWLEGNIPLVYNFHAVCVLSYVVHTRTSAFNLTTSYLSSQNVFCPQPLDFLIDLNKYFTLSSYNHKCIL